MGVVSNVSLAKTKESSDDSSSNGNRVKQIHRDDASFQSEGEIEESVNSSSGFGSGGLSVSRTFSTGEMVKSGNAPSSFLRKDPGIRRLRILVFLVLFGTGALVSAFVFLNARGAQTAEFELRWEDQSRHITRTLNDEAQSKLNNIDAFAITVQSHALLNQGQIGATWPLVVLPEFSYRASSAITNAKAQSMALVPRVESNEKRMWEGYIVDHQTWMAEGVSFQERFPDAISEKSHSRKLSTVEDLAAELQAEERSGSNVTNSTEKKGPEIVEFIWRVVDGYRVEDSRGGPYFPLWEHAPVHDGFEWVNFNMADVDIHKEAIEELLQTKEAVIGKSFDLTSTTLE